MGGGYLPSPSPLILWTGIMGGGGDNLTLPLFMPMPPLVDVVLDTQLLSSVYFSGIYDPIGFDDSEPDAFKG